MLVVVNCVSQLASNTIVCVPGGGAHLAYTSIDDDIDHCDVAVSAYLLFVCSSTTTMEQAPTRSGKLARYYSLGVQKSKTKIQ
eukprot:5554138-Pleurochrysis_carterae.AAC.3